MLVELCAVRRPHTQRAGGSDPSPARRALALMLAAAALGQLLLLRRRLLVVRVDGDSMVPTFRPADRLLVLRAPPLPRRGRVAVVRQDSANHALFVKRVIGLPGDVVIDEGLAPTAMCLGQGPPIPRMRSRSREWRIPPGQYFVCGDNRFASIDSRVWGPIAAECVVGVVLCRIGEGNGAASAKGAVCEASGSAMSQE